MQVYPDYMTILDEVMEKWLRSDFDNLKNNSKPYRMLALLLDDPSDDGDPDRHFIVDINKSEIRRKLDMLNGPYFNTIMKILELRTFNKDSEHNIP